MSRSEAATLLLVDDHAIVRAGYRHLLEQQDRFTVVGEAATAEKPMPCIASSIRIWLLLI